MSRVLQLPVTWHKNHFRDLFSNCYTDNPSFDTLLLDDSSNRQETGGKFDSDGS